MQMPICLITFTDAGKSCTDGAHCGSGRCYAATPTAASVGSDTTRPCARTNNHRRCNPRSHSAVPLPMLFAD